MRLFLASAAREEVKESCELILPQTDEHGSDIFSLSRRNHKPAGHGATEGESGGIGKPWSALGARRGSLLCYPAGHYLVISVSSGEKSRFLDGKKLRSGQRKALHPQHRASQCRGRPLAQAPRRSPRGAGGDNRGSLRTTATPRGSPREPGPVPAARKDDTRPVPG